MGAAINPYLLALAALAAGAVLWPWLARRDARLAGWISALVPGALFAWLVARVPDAGAGMLAGGQFPWVPSLGVGLDFHLDGIGLLLALLVSGVGALVLIYGGGYLKGSPMAGPFFGFIHLFMLAMLGLAAADHLLVFFMFWELTSVASYLLIGLAHESTDARKAALRALLVTGIGGVAMLAGFFLLADAAGTWRLSELAARREMLIMHPHAGWIFGLVLLGAFTKSAQVPFHFWLPGAMAAPTPVSAYLHSATMVKAGVFLLAKLFPVFGGFPAWSAVLMPVGAVTMLCGSLLALAQTDLKRLLAYSTMSALGTLVLLLGMGTAAALKAAMVFLVVHALYKAALFMVAGAVDKAAGTRDITVLHGLGARLPWMALAAALAAFSMSGVPPFIGFIGKELLYEAKVHEGGLGAMIVACGFTANAINVAIALKVGYSPFVRRGEPPEINPKARQPALLAGPMLLALAGALFGLWPDLLGKDLVTAATRDVSGRPVEITLSLWHGFNTVLMLSVVTVGVGIAMYFFRTQIRAVAAAAFGRMPHKAAQSFDTGLAGVLRAAGRTTRFFQHGNLRGYFLAVLLSLAGLTVAAIATTSWIWPPVACPLRLLPIGVVLLIMVSAVVAATAASRTTALLSLGGVGYGVSLLYALFGAPDLALTQVLVETLTLVLFAFILGRLPPISEYSSRKRRLTDLAAAGVVGVAVTLAVLAVLSAPAGSRVSSAMTAMSLPLAQGKNVVNVILVDFRALDTLGEISVLAIAALGVGGMLMALSPQGKSSQHTATPVFRASIQWLAPLMVALSVILLVRGHNEPGGGFIGGLVAAAAAVLKRLGDVDATEARAGNALRLVAGGLAIALASGLPALAHGQPFMSGIWFGSVWLPIVGTTKLGTPFVFDIGVYLVVFGVVKHILLGLLARPAGRAATSA